MSCTIISLADMTISCSFVRLEAILSSQGPKIFCAQEQYEYPVYILLYIYNIIYIYLKVNDF